MALKMKIPAGSFERALQRFSSAIDSLRDYVNALELHLAKERTSFIQENVAALAPLLYLRSQLFLKSPADPSSREDSELTEQTAREYCKTFEAIFNKDIFVDLEKPSIEIKTTDPRVGATISHVAKMWTEYDRREASFREGALVMLVGHVDVLISELIRLHVAYIDDKLNSSEYHFTYSDLKQFATIADAREALSRKRVLDAMRGGISSWIDTAKSWYGIEASYLDRTRLETLTEIGLRRNCIVHNSSKADQRYVDGNRSAVAIKLGDSIHTSAGYLKRSIDVIERDLTLFVTDLWSQCCEDASKEDIAKMMVRKSYDALRAERWETGITFAQFAKSDRQISDTTRLMAQLNYFQGHKWAGSFDRVRAEVTAIDKEPLGLLFQLAFYALLDDSERFFPAFNDALKIGQLDAWQARDFPIFREMRKDPRFAEGLAENGIKLDVDPRLDNDSLMALLMARNFQSPNQEQPEITTQAEGIVSLPRPKHASKSNSIDASDKRPQQKRKALKNKIELSGSTPSIKRL